MFHEGRAVDDGGRYGSGAKHVVPPLFHFTIEQELELPFRQAAEVIVGESEIVAADCPDFVVAEDSA